MGANTHGKKAKLFLFLPRITLFAFQVACEALGSPEPSIKWFKDGQEIRDSVIPSPRQRGNDEGHGRSVVELQVLGSADAGVYTCRASNELGFRDLNFTLSVDAGSGAGQHAVVTEARPLNSTVREGESATLVCRVKSIARPHIKWLK